MIPRYLMAVRGMSYNDLWHSQDDSHPGIVWAHASTEAAQQPRIWCMICQEGFSYHLAILLPLAVFRSDSVLFTAAAAKAQQSKSDRYLRCAIRVHVYTG